MGSLRTSLDRVLGERHVAFWSIVASVATVVALVVSLVAITSGSGGTGRGTAGGTTHPSTSLPGSPGTPTAAAPAGSSSAAAGAGLPYQADWSTGLNGWIGTGDWKAVGGMLVNDASSGSMIMSIKAPVDLDGVADYAVDADIQLVRYDLTADSFGVVVRVPPDGHGGYAAGQCYAGGATSCVAGQKNTYSAVLWTAEDAPSWLGEAPFRPNNSWHHYRVEARANQIRLLVDGARMITATDNTYVVGGAAGLWSSGSQINVRSFKVAALG